jgi:hypothetical protein
MSKNLLKDFVARKKAWRNDQAHLPMKEKARIVEILRDRQGTFRIVRGRRRKPAHS